MSFSNGSLPTSSMRSQAAQASSALLWLCRPDHIHSGRVVARDQLTFLIWALLHGLALGVVFAWKMGRKYPSRHWWAKLLGGLITFHFVCFAWIFFRASSLENALAILHSLGALTWSAGNLTPLLLVCWCLPRSSIHCRRAGSIFRRAWLPGCLLGAGTGHGGPHSAYSNAGGPRLRSIRLWQLLSIANPALPSPAWPAAARASHSRPSSPFLCLQTPSSAGISMWIPQRPRPGILAETQPALASPPAPVVPNAPPIQPQENGKPQAISPFCG